MNLNLKNSPVIAVLITCAIILFLWQAATNIVFFNWAFERHQNTLSWWARPVLMLPFCYFAFKQSLNGILLSILAIFTSMFWFPAPAQPDAQVLKFLLMEKQYLTSGWDLANILGAIGIAAFFVLISVALWRHSVKLGIGIAVAGALLKILWSVMASPDGGVSVIPFAVGGAIMLIIAALIYSFWQKYLTSKSSH